MKGCMLGLTEHTQFKHTGISVAWGTRGREKKSMWVFQRTCWLYRIDNPFWKPWSASPRRLYPWLPVLSPFSLDLFHFASSKIRLSTVWMQLLRKREQIFHQPRKLITSGGLNDGKCSCMFSPVTTSRRLNLQWEYLTVSILGVFLNSSIFIFIIIFLIWNKIIQVWGVTKSAMMKFSWSRYWGNILEING